MTGLATSINGQPKRNFERLTIHKALYKTGTYYTDQRTHRSTMILLQVGAGSRHEIHLCISDVGMGVEPKAIPIWFKKEFGSLKDAQDAILKAETNPLHLLELFPYQETDTVWRLFPEKKDGSQRDSWFQVFDETDATSWGLAWPALGNELVKELSESPSYPNSSSDVKRISEYFSRLNMVTGLFGNFKFILKEVSTRFEKLIGEGSTNHDLVDEVAGCLGLGFGQVDGYLSKGTMSPEYFLSLSPDDSYLLLLTSDLFEDRYPSLASAQYLSRRGADLLRKLRLRGVYSTEFAFKMKAISAATKFDERSARFPQYQILINEIVFGLPGIAKSYDSRKYYPARELDLSSHVRDEISRMTKAERDFVENWVKSRFSTNPSLVLYQFELANELSIELDLSYETVKLLSRYFSPSISAALSRKLLTEEDPQSIYESIDASYRFKYLLDLPEAVLDRIIDLATDDALSWLSSFNSHEVDQRWFKLSRLTLKALSSGATYYKLTYEFRETAESKTNRLALQTELMMKLGEHTHFEPFEEWKVCFYWISGELKFTVLGLKPGEQGVLQYLRDPNPEVISVIADLFGSYSLEVLSSNVATLLDWENEMSERVLIKLLTETDSNIVDELFDSTSDYRVVIAIVKSKLERFSREAVTKILEAARLADELLSFLSKLTDENKRDLWKTQAPELEKAFRNWAGFGRFYWNKSEALPKSIHEIFSTYNWLPKAVFAELTSTDFATLSDKQGALLGKFLELDNTLLENEIWLRSIITAPNTHLNAMASVYAISTGKIAQLWLFMLESKLPVSSRAGLDYLRSQKNSPDFESMLLMALDSNDQFARTSALEILAEPNPSLEISKILSKLSENRHVDVWDFLSSRLGAISDSNSLKQFTSMVFLTRLKARSQKERIKREVQDLPNEGADSIDWDVLVRMAIGSSAKDREWALRQLIALKVESNDVRIETSWKAAKNV